MSCDCELNFEYHEFVECITSALDARDPYTGDHSRRVSDMACFICCKMGIPHHETQEIHIAGHLHDIGKIGVPDRVLLKPERLNDEEWALMKKHPEIGAEILSKSEIPLGARIIAVCDSIDAMASARAYRKALPLDICHSEIEKNVGLMYDPKVAETALRNWDELTSEYRKS